MIEVALTIEEQEVLQDTQLDDQCRCRQILLNSYNIHIKYVPNARSTLIDPHQPSPTRYPC